MSSPAILHPGELRWETRLLAVVTATMVVFGIASMYGAASLLISHSGENVGASYALSQLSGAIIGGIGLLIMSRIDYRFWQRIAWPLLFVTIVLLIIPLLPPLRRIAPEINGARRWVNLGFTTIQPSELARLAIVIWCAMLAAKKGEQVRQFKKGVLPFLLVIGLVAGLVLLEPNLSMATLVGLLGMLVLFTAGAKIGHFLLLGFGAVLLVANRIHDVEYRIRRFTAFMDGSSAKAAEGFQLHQSIVGFGSGRILGLGFGQGQQKLGYVPYAYSDFLFSTIGEEWGFLGVCVVVLLFFLFCWMGFRIARTASDQFGQYLAVGLTAAIGISAFLHMAVTMGLMPTTGLTLPFMSHGRSSLIISLLGTGILINIGRQRGRPTPQRAGKRAGGKAGK
ncbi:MAG: putative peptidoglycan glycosyltransferase FtsW [Gemmatimonadota bacterium]